MSKTEDILDRLEFHEENGTSTEEELAAHDEIERLREDNALIRSREESLIREFEIELATTSRLREAITSAHDSIAAGDDFGGFQYLHDALK